MNDPAWCRSKVDRLEEELRSYSNARDRFGSDLDEKRLLWHDTAARDTFARYLDPYCDEVDQTLKRLADQLSQLGEVVARMDDAEKPADDISRYSEESAQLREKAENEVYTAHNCVDLALDEAAAADDMAEQATLVLASI